MAVLMTTILSMNTSPTQHMHMVLGIIMCVTEGKGGGLGWRKTHCDEKLKLG